MTGSVTPWLPDDWQHPARVMLSTGHHLRPIRAADVDLDLPAVMGSRERLWSIYGSAWGWPPATMTAEQDREDLAHHEAEIERHESFNYALFDPGETALLGCVYIDPAREAGSRCRDLVVGGRPARRDGRSRPPSTPWAATLRGFRERLACWRALRSVGSGHHLRDWLALRPRHVPDAAGNAASHTVELCGGVCVRQVGGAGRELIAERLTAHLLEGASR